MTRILVVGGGLIGRRHVAAVQAHPGAALAGVVDPDPAVSVPAAVPRFTSLEAVDVPVDGAILAVPTPLHGEMGLEAARRGWPTLIEKPVAGTLSEAEALEAAFAAAHVPALVGHHRRYHPSVALMKRVIAEGDLGTIVAANLIWAVRKPDAYFSGNWRTSGGSPVMINLVHDVDVLRFVLGSIVEVAGFPGAALRGTDRIESGAVALRLASGATASITFADTAPSPWGFEAGTGENPNIGTTGQDMFWVMGTKASISFPSLTLWGGAADWSTAATPQTLSCPAREGTPLDWQLDHFLAVIAGRATPMIGIADASETLRIAQDIEAILTPANTRYRMRS